MLLRYWNPTSTYHRYIHRHLIKWTAHWPSPLAVFTAFSYITSPSEKVGLVVRPKFGTAIWTMYFIQIYMGTLQVPRKVYHEKVNITLQATKQSVFIHLRKPQKLFKMSLIYWMKLIHLFGLESIREFFSTSEVFIANRKSQF